MPMRSHAFAALLAALLMPGVLCGQASQTSAPSPENIQRLIEQLSDRSFDARELATRRLIVLGGHATNALAAAAEKGDPETSWRSVHALLEITLSSDIDIVGPAEDALIALKNSSNTVASDRAAQAIERIAPLREERAIAALKHLGAKVTIEDNSVLFDGSWTGGDAGLKHLLRLRELRQVNIEPTAEISDRAVEKLERDRPETRVLQFGKAFLGVGTSPSDTDPGLTVLTLVEGGAASNAGIKEGDVIYHIDGMPVNVFEDLVKSIAKKVAGDEIEIDYYSRTDSARKRVKTKLGKRPGTE